MRMIEVDLVLHLDKDQVRELGLDEALNDGDECEVRGIAKVTKTKRAGPGMVELQIVKIGVGDVDPSEEPMKAYAKRRNLELTER